MSRRRRNVYYRCRVCRTYDVDEYGWHCGQLGEPVRIPYLKPWEIAKMKRPEKAKKGESIGEPAKGELLCHCPALWEHLTCDKWDDGTIRERSTLSFFCDAQAAKLCLSDRATDRIAFVAAESLDAALLMLNEQLDNGTLLWRESDTRRRRR
jgi:hypothetical protein